MKKWAERVLAEAVPKIAESAYVIAVAPMRGTEDVKMAVEIGFAILLDKPLIVLKPVGQGRVYGDKLMRVADHVIDGDMTTEEGREAVQQKLRAILQQ